MPEQLHRDASLYATCALRSIDENAVLARESVTIYSPRTAQDLVDTIVLLAVKRVPVLPFQRVIDFHESYPSLHSTASWNLLLQWSCRHRLTGTSDWILRSMETQRLQPTLWTWAYRIRLRMQRQMWWQARRGLKALHDRFQEDEDIPGVYLSLLAEVQRSSAEIQRPIPPSKTTSHRRQVRSTQVMELSRLEDLLLRHILDLDASDNHKGIVKYPVTWMEVTVRSLLRTDRLDTAHEAVLSWLRDLPPAIPSRHVPRYRQVVHRLLGARLPDSDRGIGSFNIQLDLFEELFSAHPQIIPDSRSINLLFSHLDRSSGRGKISFYWLRKFKLRYGHHVEDTRVRRQVMHFALHSQRPDIVRQMIGRELAFREEQAAALLERSVTEGPGQHRGNRLQDSLHATGSHATSWIRLLKRTREKRVALQNFVSLTRRKHMLASRLKKMQMQDALDLARRFPWTSQARTQTIAHHDMEEKEFHVDMGLRDPSRATLWSKRFGVSQKSLDPPPRRTLPRPK